MSYTIKHMGLGGILDQAIAITRDHFKLLFTIMLLLLIPVSLIQGFIVYSITPALAANPSNEDLLEAQQFFLNYLPLFAGIWLLNVLVVYPVTNGAVIYAVARLYLGQSITAVEAIREGFGKILPLVGTSILVSLALMGGFILCVIPFFVLAILFGLSQHVVMLENLSGPTAMKRSMQLIQKDWGAFLALGLILLVISIMLSFGANFIPQPHLRIIGSTLLQAVTTILWTAALVVFYFSCRCNVENFDLHFLAEAIGAEPAANRDGGLRNGPR